MSKPPFTVTGILLTTAPNSLQPIKHAPTPSWTDILARFL